MRTLMSKEENACHTCRVILHNSISITYHKRILGHNVAPFSKLSYPDDFCSFRAEATCPKCGALNPVHVRGSTCLKPIQGIEYLCKQCLYEW